MFDQISVEDPRVSELCNKTSEPSPYQILLTCLQKNHGMGDTNIDTEMVPMKKHQKSKYIMRLGAYYFDFTNFFVQRRWNLSGKIQYLKRHLMIGLVYFLL